MIRDAGQGHTVEPVARGRQVNEWVKRAVVMYFSLQPMGTIRTGELEFYDKMDIEHDFTASAS